jgi:hypothetical protein
MARLNNNSDGIFGPAPSLANRVAQLMLTVTGSQCSGNNTNSTSIDGEYAHPTLDGTGAQRVKVTNLPTVDANGVQAVNIVSGTMQLSGTVDTNVTNQVAITVTSSLPTTVTNFPTQFAVTSTGSIPVVSTNGALESTQALGIPLMPTLSNVWRFGVTGSQSTQLSLLSAPRAGVITAISASKVFTLKGDPFASVFYAFSNAATGQSISSEDTYGASQCSVLFPGERYDGRIPVGVSSLIVSASVTSSISLSVTS